MLIRLSVFYFPNISYVILSAEWNWNSINAILYVKLFIFLLLLIFMIKGPLNHRKRVFRGVEMVLEWLLIRLYQKYFLGLCLNSIGKGDLQCPPNFLSALHFKCLVKSCPWNFYRWTCFSVFWTLKNSIKLDVNSAA